MKHLTFLLYLSLQACTSFIVSDEWMRVLDLDNKDLHDIRTFLEEKKSCLGNLRLRFREASVPRKYFLLDEQNYTLGDIAMFDLNEINMVRNETLSILKMDDRLLPEMTKCLEDKDCSWLFDHANTLCGVGNPHVLSLAENVLTNHRKIFFGLVQALTAFLMPSKSYRRSLATVANPESDWIISGVATRFRNSIAAMIRRLSMWNHESFSVKSVPFENVHLNRFFQTVQSKHASFDVAHAQSASEKITKVIMSRVRNIYEYFPVEMKLVGVQSLFDDKKMIQLFEYSKEMKPYAMIEMNTDFNNIEISNMKLFVNGNDESFEKVSDAITSRMDFLNEEEERAVVMAMKEITPLVRMSVAMLLFFKENQYE